MTNKERRETQREIDKFITTIKSFPGKGQKKKRLGAYETLIKNFPIAHYKVLIKKAQSFEKKGDKIIKEEGLLYSPFNKRNVSSSTKEDLYKTFKTAGDLYSSVAKMAVSQEMEKSQVQLLLKKVDAMYSSAQQYILESEQGLKLTKKKEDLEDFLEEARYKSKATPAFLSIASFVLALFFSALNFTGNVIGNTQQDFAILGILFFIAGLVFVFVYARSKR